jgi:hypothetical protein
MPWWEDCQPCQGAIDVYMNHAVMLHKIGNIKTLLCVHMKLSMGLIK